jgi:hypothetical protein
MAMNAIYSLVVDVLRGYRRKREMVTEIEDLTERDRERLFSEIDVTPGEFRDFCRHALAADDLLTPAMQSVGIGLALFSVQHPALQRDMQRICMACRHRLRCRYHLKASTFRQNQRAFCGNSDNFATITKLDADDRGQPTSLVRA